jgi:hypothetical protein
MTIATSICLLILLVTTTLFALLWLRVRTHRRNTAAPVDDGPVVRRPVFFEHELV